MGTAKQVALRADRKAGRGSLRSTTRCEDYAELLTWDRASPRLCQHRSGQLGTFFCFLITVQPRRVLTHLFP